MQKRNCRTDFIACTATPRRVNITHASHIRNEPFKIAQSVRSLKHRARLAKGEFLNGKKYLLNVRVFLHNCREQRFFHGAVRITLAIPVPVSPCRDYWVFLFSLLFFTFYRDRHEKRYLWNNSLISILQWTPPVHSFVCNNARETYERTVSCAWQPWISYLTDIDNLIIKIIVHGRLKILFVSDEK